MLKKAITSGKRRAALLLLAVCLLLSTAAADICFKAKAEDGLIEFENVYYELADGEASAVDCEKSNRSAIVIPSEVGGCPVTRIGPEAFFRAKISAVTIPDSVTVIEEHAFDSCSGMTEAALGKNVADIGELAFYGCTSLKSFKVDDGNSYYTADAQGILYKKDMSELIQYATGNERESFIIPEGVSVIGPYAFGNARKLKSVTLPESLRCTGEYAFYYCTGLTSVTFPDGVTDIGFASFDNCVGLTGVDIGSGVKSIDDNVFRNCKKLEDISVSGASAFFTVDENGVLFEKDMKVLRQYPAGSALTEYTIPDGVEEIGVYAFGYAVDLKKITLPEGVKTFGESAFYGCSGLTAINLPESLTEIGGDAFRGCAKLSDVTLPDSLESIGYYAFYDCASLESVIIPDGVGHLGYQAFYGCGSLAFAHLPAGIDYIDGDVFGNCPILAYVCSDTSDCYAATYAAENGLPYRACAGHHPILAKHAPDSFTGVNLEYEAGAFNGSVLLSATPVGWDEIFMTHPDCEEALAPNPRESLCGAYIINVTDSSGGPARLNEGQKVRLYIPVPEGADYKKSRVCRVADETGSVIRSFVYKPRPGFSDALFTVPEDGSYFIIETDSFGPFILLTEVIETTISINGYTPERTEDYKTTMRFSATATLPPDGAEIHWFIDGVDRGTGESFSVRRAKESYTVQVKLIDGYDGEIFAESETENVYIHTGFWAKVLAFLRMIFFLLPDITQ